MDIIELLKQHQIALMKAERHEGHARDDDGVKKVLDYELRIKNLRADLGVHQY